MVTLTLTPSGSKGKSECFTAYLRPSFRRRNLPQPLKQRFKARSRVIVHAGTRALVIEAVTFQHKEGCINDTDGFFAGKHPVIDKSAHQCSDQQRTVERFAIGRVVGHYVSIDSWRLQRNRWRFRVEDRL